MLSPLPRISNKLDSKDLHKHLSLGLTADIITAQHKNRGVYPRRLRGRRGRRGSPTTRATRGTTGTPPHRRLSRGTTPLAPTFLTGSRPTVESPFPTPVSSVRFLTPFPLCALTWISPFPRFSSFPTSLKPPLRVSVRFPSPYLTVYGSFHVSPRRGSARTHVLATVTRRAGRPVKYLIQDHLETIFFLLVHVAASTPKPTFVTRNNSRV